MRAAFFLAARGAAGARRSASAFLRRSAASFCFFVSGFFFATGFFFGAFARVAGWWAAG